MGKTSLNLEEDLVKVSIVEYLRAGIPIICPDSCGQRELCPALKVVYFTKLKEMSLPEVILKKEVLEVLSSTI